MEDTIKLTFLSVGCIVGSVMYLFSIWLFMSLFNWIVPMFGITIQLDYWQTLGIAVLLSLFGTFLGKK
jgi:hypothetical protein